MVGIGFLAAFVICLVIIIVKAQRIKFVVVSLKLSRTWFWDNPYAVLVSLGMTAVSVLALYLNLRILELSELQDGQQ